MSLDKLIRNITVVAAMAVPMYGCEGDTTENKNYHGNEGGSGGDNCNTICEDFKELTDECTATPEDRAQGYSSNCIKECEENTSAYNSHSCPSCINLSKTYTLEKDRCEAVYLCMVNTCGIPY